jgi:hypothetical protein
MRRLLPCLALLAALAAPAPAAAAETRLSKSQVGVLAMDAAGDDAVVLLSTGRPNRPFAAVRSSGRGVTALGTFGEFDAREPGVAGDTTGRAYVGWSRPVSGGLALFAAPVPSGPVAELDVGTGPGVFELADDGSAVAAFPDRAGDATVVVTPRVARPSRGSNPYAMPSERRLSSDAPRLRHRPLDIALTPAGPVVLDLIQRRGATTLRVFGPRAPSATLLSVRGLQNVSATLAADGDTIAVAYRRGARVVLATSARGGSWRRRTLPGTRALPASGAPAVALDRGEPTVAWARGTGARELYVLRNGSVRRLTRTVGDDSAPLAAARADGGVFVAWTGRRGGRRTPLLTLLR